MDQSSESPAPQNFDCAAARLLARLDFRRADIEGLARGIAKTQDMNSRRLKLFIAEAEKIHKSLGGLWDRLEDLPEIDATIVEQVGLVSRRLLNLENGLSTHHRNLFGTPYQFSSFPDLGQVQQNGQSGDRNPPLPNPSQEPAFPSQSRPAAILPKNKASRRRGNST